MPRRREGGRGIDFWKDRRGKCGCMGCQSRLHASVHEKGREKIYFAMKMRWYLKEKAIYT